MSDNISREEFLRRMGTRVRQRDQEVRLLEGFANFDQEAKPIVRGYLDTLFKLVEQLTGRGISAVQAWKPESAPSKAEAFAWARHFARIPNPANYGTVDLVFAKEHDRALVPFLQANDDALMALHTYIKSRLDV